MGGQGVKKTSWLENLCPRDLYPDYIYTGELDLNKKADTVWKLSEYFIVNVEEQIKALNRQDSNTMKSLITLPDIKGRRPYARIEAQGVRRANFAASTNDDDFLTDHSGSRRYLCFKILAIDWDRVKKVDIDKVWSEAFKLWDSKNFVYWTDENDIKELSENNNEFANLSREHQYVSQYFLKPCEEFAATHAMPSAIICDYLQLVTNSKYQIKNHLIGAALKSNGYEKKSTRLKAMGSTQNAWHLHIRKDYCSNEFLKPFEL
jgi:predicted P-loop ATPase